ncbi:MAG: molybdopterin converting factor subunit 1 [Anaerolineales bacterium]|jgi:molybdopterin converting factor subunit 1|nr:molybdopterin converting factor subunit 1 [Anaerolineales bacterium]
MMVRVLFFATLRERAGGRAFELEIPEGANVARLKETLVERFPNLAPNRDVMLVAVNRDFAFDDRLIPAGAEIAIFPPVSGG